MICSTGYEFDHLLAEGLHKTGHRLNFTIFMTQLTRSVRAKCIEGSTACDYSSVDSSLLLEKYERDWAHTKGIHTCDMVHKPHLSQFCLPGHQQV